VEDAGGVVVAGASAIRLLTGLTVTDNAGTPEVTATGGGGGIPTVQFHLRRVICVQGSNTPLFEGFNAPTLLGVAGTPALSTSSFTDSQVKIRHTADAGGNNGAGRARNGTGTSILALGDAAGIGGYLLNMRFALVTLFSGARGFFGVTDTSPLAGVEPASRTDILGIGWSSAQSTFRMIHNDASGTATDVDTGVSLTTGITYEVELDCAPNSASVEVRLYSVTASGRTLLFTGNPTSDLPTGSAFLSPHSAVNNGTQASQCVMDFHHWLATTR
jgi:hypothetical protein